MFLFYENVMNKVDMCIATDILTCIVEQVCARSVSSMFTNFQSQVTVHIWNNSAVSVVCPTCTTFIWPSRYFLHMVIHIYLHLTKFAIFSTWSWCAILIVHEASSLFSLRRGGGYTVLNLTSLPINQSECRTWRIAKTLKWLSCSYSTEEVLYVIDFFLSNCDFLDTKWEWLFEILSFTTA